jgi:hypothetical protein
LDKYITCGSGFGGPCYHSPSGGVGDELIEDAIARSSTHDVDRVQAAPDECFDAFQDLPVA